MHGDCHKNIKKNIAIISVIYLHNDKIIGTKGSEKKIVLVCFSSSFPRQPIITFIAAAAAAALTEAAAAASSTLINTVPDDD